MFLSLSIPNMLAAAPLALSEPALLPLNNKLFEVFTVRACIHMLNNRS